MELASDLLVRAVKFDNDNRKVEALSLYTEGINKLLDVAKGESDPGKKAHYHRKIEEFLKRAEALKESQAADLARRKTVKKVYIPENACGRSYESLFGAYLDTAVRAIVIDEPYLGRVHQLFNLIMFVELCVSNCSNLKIIKLITRHGEEANEQSNAFSQLKEDLAAKHIKFVVEYSESLHDRSIVLDNGYTIQLGKGLHFFKKKENKYGLGHNDYRFRQCYETNIEILKI